MKFIFICLLIANAVLFALGRGYLASPISQVHQPQRLLQQENSERLKLISAGVANSPIPSLLAQASQVGNPLTCLEWGVFHLSEINKVEAQLKPLSFGNRQSRQAAQETASTIVYIPPSGSKAAAERKAEELTNLGVTDFFIIQDQSSSLRWGISLGVFKSEEAARKLLARLASNGVRNAKLAARTVVSNKFNYVFREVTSLEKVSLEKLKTKFPAQELRVCK